MRVRDLLSTQGATQLQAGPEKGYDHNQSGKSLRQLGAGNRAIGNQAVRRVMIPKPLRTTTQGFILQWTELCTKDAGGAGSSNH